MARPGREVVAEVRRRLDTIGDPCAVAQGVPMGLEEMGLIETVELDREGNLEIRMRLTSPSCMMGGYFKVEAERVLGEIPEVRSVAVSSDLGLDWRPEMLSASAQRRRGEALRARMRSSARPLEAARR